MMSEKALDYLYYNESTTQAQESHALKLEHFVPWPYSRSILRGPLEQPPMLQWREEQSAKELW